MHLASSVWVQPACTATAIAAKSAKQTAARSAAYRARDADRGRPATARLEIGHRTEARARDLAGVLVQHPGGAARGGRLPHRPAAVHLVRAHVGR